MKRGGRSDANGPNGSGAASDHNVHDAVVVDVGEGDAGKGDVVIDGELHAFGDGDLGSEEGGVGTSSIRGGGVGLGGIVVDVVVGGLL